MSCREVYPILIPWFSSSLLSSPCWHHQLLTLRETCLSHCSSTLSQLFHLSYSSPAPSSLHCTIPPWVSQQPPTLLPTHFVCPQRDVSLPLPSSLHFLPLTVMSPSFSFAYSHLSHSGNTCPCWHILPSSVGCLLVLP